MIRLGVAKVDNWTQFTQKIHSYAGHHFKLLFILTNNAVCSGFFVDALKMPQQAWIYQSPLQYPKEFFFNFSQEPPITIKEKQQELPKTKKYH